MSTIWECKIGIAGDVKLPPGADGPMRDAVARAYRELTGQDAEFLFSGWGAELSRGEQEVVNEKGPGVAGIHFTGFDQGGKA